MFRKNIRRKYTVRPFRIKNYCKYFKLEDNLEIIAFNKRISNPKNNLRWIFSKRHDYTDKFLRAIKERIWDNSNLIIVIYGTPNSGKSEGAQTIAFFIRYTLWKYMNVKAKISMAFSTADFQDILPDMELGDVGIRDESSGLSGAGSKNVQKSLDNITKAIRMEQNSFIFVDPTQIRSKVVSYYLETAGKNKKTRKIRFILYDKNEDPLGRIYLSLHWSGLFRKKYKAEKQANINALKALGGMVTPEISKKRMVRDEKRLLKYCLDYGINKKTDIKSMIDRYNRQFDKIEDMIKGDTNYMNVLIGHVWIDIKFGRRIKKEKVKEVKSKINYKNGQSFAEFVRMNIPENAGGRPNYIVARIAEGLAKGYSYDAIGANHKDIGIGIINTTSIWIRREAPVDIRLGFLFEKWFALSIAVQMEQLDNLLGGNKPNKPDLIWKDKIYSIKFIIRQHLKTIKFRQSIDLGPEYREARKRKCTYILVFMNPAWELKVQLIELDPFKDPDEIIIKRPDLMIKKPIKMLDMG